MRGALLIGTAVLWCACGGDDDGGDGGDPGDGTDAGDHHADAADTGGRVLADDYPGDDGLGDDPAVVWFEPFDADSVDAVTARYDQAQGQARMELVSDQPAGAGGSAMAMTAGQGVDAVDLYKMLPGHDEIWVRWYAKYQPDVPWHHSGMWFGGYNPPMPYPSPMAGISPDGDDRFSLSIEPIWQEPELRFDFYAYWMRMHSWMEAPFPPDDGTAYYGNSMIHANDFTVDEDAWVCLEVHVRLNDDLASGGGAVLEVWKDDVRVVHFDDAGPMGYWIRDKFCPDGADGTECTDYPAPADEILDLQFRTTADLTINAFWPQNYITENAMGTLTFDQMVVATTRVGCLR
jgi:hypothetical protein